MNARFLRLAGLSFVLSAILLLGACHKKSVPRCPTPASAASGKTNRDFERFAFRCAARPVRAIELEHAERHRCDHRLARSRRSQRDSKPHPFGIDNLHADGQRSGRYGPGDRAGDRYGTATATRGGSRQRLRIWNCFSVA